MCPVEKAIYKISQNSQEKSSHFSKFTGWDFDYGTLLLFQKSYSKDQFMVTGSYKKRRLNFHKIHFLESW